MAVLPGGELSGPALILLGVPFLAGLAAGGLLERASPSGLPRLLGAAVLAGVVAGLLVQVCVVASRGGLGSGRLADLGPGGSRVALLAAAVIGAGTVVGALSRRALSRPA